MRPLKLQLKSSYVSSYIVSLTSHARLPHAPPPPSLPYSYELAQAFINAEERKQRKLYATPNITTNIP